MASVRSLWLAMLILGVWAFQASASRELSMMTMSERHEHWMSQYGRAYKDAAEKAHRLSIFKSNMELIETFNAGNHEFKLGANQFADLTNDEYVRVCSGYHPPLMTTVKAANGFRYENATNLPPSLDWRLKGAVTPVKHQGNCGEQTVLTDFVYPIHITEVHISSLVILCING